MGEDWVKLLTSSSRFKADIVIGMLESNGLRAVKLDQKDSAHIHIGSIEIFVHREDYIKANYLIENIEE